MEIDQNRVKMMDGKKEISMHLMSDNPLEYILVTPPTKCSITCSNI